MLTQLFLAMAYFQPEIMEADREARQLTHLVAAYTVVWVILAFFLVILMLRNRKLLNRIGDLEGRLADLEKNQ